MTYFIPTPATLEELKKAYRELARKHHPDAGGGETEMKQVNAEYERLFEELKEIHVNAKGETYRKATAETPEHFINIINELIRLEDILIEIMGSFIWVSGETKQYKEKLKELGFKWSVNKSSWYLPPEGYKRYGKGTYSLDEIRGMYGSQEVQTKPLRKIEAS